MEVFPVVLHLWTLWLLVFSSFATSFVAFKVEDDPSMVYTYSRFDEVQEKCGSILSSASELEPDDDRGNRIKKELSFVNGDWDQESGGAPLMPFDDREIERFRAGPVSFLKLVSFWVVDVDPVRRAKNMVSISGILDIAITGLQFFNSRPSSLLPNFYMHPGTSLMSILFEGVYIESGKNGGQRLICLLGTSKMPTTNQFIDSAELTDEYGYKFRSQPSLVQDDQILLILRYTKTFSLISGNVSGEMKSLHEKSNFKYFDRVHISSQLGRHSKYQFGAEVAEELLSKACSPYPYQDNLVDEDAIKFNDDNYCDTLQNLVSKENFDFVPHWKSVRLNDGNKLGPFILSGKSKAIDDGSKNYRLIVQNLQCNAGIDQNKIKTTRVSALFRVTHSWEERYLSGYRTGLSGMTLFAEGIWRPSGGQLCMVGCLGIAGTASERCNSRICLYLPLTFSIKRRTKLFGTITSINDTESHASLLFEKVTHFEDLFHENEWNKNLKWSYKYSKIMQARDFQRRSEPSVLGTYLRKSLLVYPSLNGTGIVSLSLLANELSFRVSAVPHRSFSFSKAHTQRTCVELGILSVGSLVGRYWPQRRNPPEVERSSNFSAEMIEISGRLSVTGEQFNSISLSVEGIYNSIFGKMYLIGCRDVQVVPENIKKEMNLEGGMDCLFEVKIDYPPRNGRWLINQEVKVSINSKRSKVDSLYSSPVSLKTNPIAYNKQLPDLIFRETFEDVLRILMLTMAIVLILSQFHYVNNVVDPIAYTSLVMLGIQTLGYCIQLISDDEILFKLEVLQSRSYQTNDSKKFERFDLLHCIIKVLSLYALMLTLSLGEKVYESRTRQISLTNQQQSKFPEEKKIFLITSAIYVVGFLVIDIVRVVITSEPFRSLAIVHHCERSNIQKLLQWLKKLDDGFSLVQDFFLLPQIVANTFWQIKGKPLRKLYYLGFTSLRVLLHAYDYIAHPVPVPVPDDNYNDCYNKNEYTNWNLYSKFGNIIVAVIVVIFAVIVHKQQQYNYRGFSRLVKPKEHKDTAHKSELYERLLS